MKILQIVDTYSWAIGTLAKAIQRYNQHLSWRSVEVHPKDLEQGKVDLGPIVDAVRACDVVDVQYWRTFSQLCELIPELKEKPVILTHHNEKNLLSYQWPKNVIHVAKTRHSEKVLRESYPDAYIAYIPNSYDHTRFKFNAEYPPKEKAVGYVGRIAPWKGLKEVARACRELGYPLMVMGKHDKMDYFGSIPEEDRANIDWSFFNCEDEARPEFYRHVTCYVGNSGGGREVGTLGLIEAMATGVPVVTTPSGLAADACEDDENAVVVDYDDYDGLREAISQVMESPSLQGRLRRKAWETIRGYNDERMAWQYRALLNTVLYRGPLVSVVIPTTPDRADRAASIVQALERQTYHDIEAVVVFDQCPEVTPELRCQVSSSKLAVKVLATGDQGGYSLAKARNLAVIEADGEYVMLNDSRLLPHPESVAELVAAARSLGKTEKAWVFGEKGGEKDTFVENFSLVRRDQLIEAGMFNERIDRYGGMSQELRVRFGRQGFKFGYTPAAKAEQMVHSTLTPEKRDGIVAMKNRLWKLKLV